MTREVTDNLYIDLGYFTPEEYYVYEAEAQADFATTVTLSATPDGYVGQTVEASGSWSSTATVSVTLDKIVELVSDLSVVTEISATAARLYNVDTALSVTATQTTNNSRIRETTTAVTGAFTASMDAVITKNGSMDFVVVAGFDATPVRNRAVDITLDTIANVNAQAQRTADTSAALSASATLAADLTQVLIVDFSAALSSTATLSATGKGFVVSSPVVWRGVGKPEINYTTTKFGAGSLYLNGSSYLYAADSARFEIPSSNGSSAGNFTVEVHIYPTDSGSVAQRRHILGQWSGNNLSQQGWRLTHEAGGSNANVQFYFLSTNGTEFSLFTTGNPLVFNQWNHIAVVRRYEPNNNLNFYSLWVNGTQYDTTGLTNSALYVNSGQMRIGYNGYTNNSETYFKGYIDAINFRVGSARYSPYDNTITVPTAEYSTIVSNDRILTNFNSNYLDQSYPSYVTFASALSSTATISATPQKSILSSADLTSTASLTANIGKLQDYTAELPVIATQLTAVAKVGQGLVACDVVASLQANANVITENELDFTADFAQAVTTDRTRDFDTSLSADFAQSSDISVTTENELDFFSDFAQTANVVRTRDVDSNLSADFAQSVDFARTRDVDSTQSATATVTAQLGIVKEYAVDLPAIATQLSAVAKIGQGLIDCQVIATLDCDIEVTSGSVVNIASNATLEAQAGKLQIAQADVTANAQLSAQPEVVGTLSADLSAQFAQTAEITRQRDYATALSSTFTQSTTVEIVKSAQATLSTQALTTASASRTRDVVANLPVIASQLTVGSETNDLRANLSAQFTLQCSVIEVRIDPDLTYMVPKETRNYSIAEEWRDDIVIPESRNYTIVKEIRDYNVLNTDESYII